MTAPRERVELYPDSRGVEEVTTIVGEAARKG
jgi:hypothetical protein